MLFIEKCWLAGKYLLNNILQSVIKIINHVKVRAFNSCLFAQLCEMDAEHTCPLLYTEVRCFLKVDHWPEGSGQFLS